MAVANSGFIPGAQVPAPELMRYAQTAAIPPENFVGNLVFPDAQVDSFMGIAPIIGNEALEAWDDDTVGNKTDFNEVQISQGDTSWELGMHGRKAIIGVVAIMKAKMAAQMARGAGNATADPVFDLESRVTNVLVAQNARHNELLKIGQLINEDNYDDANVFDSIEIETTTELIPYLLAASEQVEAAGRGPANAIIFGKGAASGARKNENLMALLPEDAIQFITPELFTTLLQLPVGQAQVLFATAMYRKRAGDAPVAMMDDFIWVGRIPQAGNPDGNVFGRNYWHPCEQNGQRLYVNRLLVGNAENRHIGVLNFYRPAVEDANLGVLIPITHEA